MNKYIKVCSIIILMIFSFYYTEKVAIYVQNNTPLKKEIISYKEKNTVMYVNAQVDGDYIIPGINGLEVNVDKSYNKMKPFNVFSENYLIYDQIKPRISVSSFKDKIIHRGNIQKNAVSLIINKTNNYLSYLDSKKINYDLINKTNYCIKTKMDTCKNTKKQIVEPTIILNNQNFLKNVGIISKGYLIYIDDDININYIYALINHIKYNNLNILKLNQHLSENFEL